jgi:hypothetical protein
MALALADFLEEVAADRHVVLPGWVEDAAVRIACIYLDDTTTEEKHR